MTFRVLSFYRLDIVKNAPDQLNHALCGFQTRIRRGVLTDGVYRVGILALRRFSRQKIYDWGETILYVDDGRTDIQGSI